MFCNPNVPQLCHSLISEISEEVIQVFECKTNSELLILALLPFPCYLSPPSMGSKISILLLILIRRVVLGVRLPSPVDHPLFLKMNFTRGTLGSKLQIVHDSIVSQFPEEA